MSNTKPLLRILATLATLFLFLIAINLLGSSFKLLGQDFVQTLFTSTLNPLSGLFLGVLATVLVQSSSVTTSIIVGLVSGGVLSIESAVPIVMGANIGTTVTNLIVSFGHVSQKEEFRRAFSGSLIHDFFNILSVSILLPLELATGFLSKSAAFLSGMLYGGMEGIHYQSPIKVAVGTITKSFQHWVIETVPFSNKVVGVLLIILAMLLIFVCLFGLVKLLRRIMIDRVVKVLDKALSKSAIITMALGATITALLQSSSVTTSLLVPLIGAGIITLEVAFPITLGANIGTTVTALLAALAGTEAGLTVALVHLLFNIVGIMLLYPFKPVREIPLSMARWFGVLVAKKRRMAVFYVLFVFFVIPFTVMLITRAFN